MSFGAGSHSQQPLLALQGEWFELKPERFTAFGQIFIFLLVEEGVQTKKKSPR